MQRLHGLQKPCAYRGYRAYIGHGLRKVTEATEGMGFERGYRGYRGHGLTEVGRVDGVEEGTVDFSQSSSSIWG